MRRLLDNFREEFAVDVLKTLRRILKSYKPVKKTKRLRERILDVPDSDGDNSNHPKPPHRPSKPQHRQSKHLPGSSSGTRQLPIALSIGKITTLHVRSFCRQGFVARG